MQNTSDILHCIFLTVQAGRRFATPCHVSQMWGYEAAHAVSGSRRFVFNPTELFVHQ